MDIKIINDYANLIADMLSCGLQINIEKKGDDAYKVSVNDPATLSQVVVVMRVNSKPTSIKTSVHSRANSTMTTVNNIDQVMHNSFGQ